MYNKHEGRFIEPSFFLFPRHQYTQSMNFLSIEPII